MYSVYSTGLVIAKKKMTGPHLGNDYEVDFLKLLQGHVLLTTLRQ
jgi:hypothetical protein